MLQGDGSDSGGGRAPFLRRLDDAVVPVLQERTQRARDLLARPFRAVARWEDGSWFAPVARNRGVLAFLAVVVATAASAVHFDRYPDLRAAQAGNGQPPVRAGTGEPVGPTPTAPAVSEVGPPLGAEVDAYIDDRTSALRDLDADPATPVVAIVSFDTYLTPDQVVAALPGDATVVLAQYRLPAEGEPPLETEVVGGDLGDAVDRAVQEALEPLREEEAEVERLLESGTVEDEEYRADYERRLSELRSVRNVVETGAPVVFAVVVEAPLGSLQVVPGREHVRLVDLAPPGAAVGRSSFYGVRPEDTDRATYGRTS